MARVERRLAAFMAADIVAYSRLIETDEARTLTASWDEPSMVEFALVIFWRESDCQAVPNHVRQVT